MKQIIPIFAGGAGVQIGSEFLSNLVQQHSLSLQGQTEDIQGLQTFFQQKPSGFNGFRGLFIDLDPYGLKFLQHQSHRNFIHPSYKFTGKIDGADNYNLARYTQCGDMWRQFGQTVIRKSVQACDSLQSFFLVGSISGGSGSSLISFLSSSLSGEFGKISKTKFLLFPSESFSNTTLQYMNFVLALEQIIDQSGCNLVFDNQALYKICQNKLGIQLPSFSDTNRLIAQAISTFTSGIRFSGANIKEIQTNLIPYKRINFISHSMAPLTYKPYTEQESLFSDVLQPSNFTTSYHTGIQISSVIAAQGFSYRNFKNFVSMRENLDFSSGRHSVMYSPRKQFLNVSGEFLSYQESLGLFGSYTGMGVPLKSILKKFDLSYAKRAFVHWYVGIGLSEGFFECARQNLMCLVNDYKEIGREIMR